jgi:hypothetical protein
MLLSFERPAASPAGAFPRTLKTAQQCQHQRPLSSGRDTGITGPNRIRLVRSWRRPDHRQDRKGTRWMPRHQESKKGVNGCDKPRGGAE